MGNKLMDAIVLFICFDLLILDIAIIIIYNMIQNIKNEKKYINEINKNEYNDTTKNNKINFSTGTLSLKDLMFQIKRNKYYKKDNKKDIDNYMSNYNEDDYKNSLERIDKHENK